MSRPIRIRYVSHCTSLLSTALTYHSVGPASETVNYHKPGFLSKFLELQGVMWQTNQGLTDRHAYDSRPSAWPLLRRGIVRLFPRAFSLLTTRFLQNFWVKEQKQVYLIGNPVTWWTSTLAVLAYLGLRALLVLREKRGFRDLERRELRSALIELSLTLPQPPSGSTTKFAASSSSDGHYTTFPSS
jgi:dolichyl-phosphate-mannose--protein O-mannosyl transferase